MTNQNAFGVSEFDWAPLGFDVYEVPKSTSEFPKRYYFPKNIQATTEKITALSDYYSTSSKVVDVFADALQNINSEIYNTSLKTNVKSFLRAFAKGLNYPDAQPNILPPIRIEVDFEKVVESSSGEYIMSGYPSECLRGISDKNQRLKNGLGSFTLFNNFSVAKRTDGFDELSVTWNDSDEAVQVIFSQRKDS